MTAKYYYSINSVDDGAFICLTPVKYWNENKFMSDFELNLDQIYDDWPFGCEETDSTYSTPINYFTVEESIAAAEKWLSEHSDFEPFPVESSNNQPADLRFRPKSNDQFVNFEQFEQLLSQLQDKELTQKIINFICGYLDKETFSECSLSKHKPIKKIFNYILDAIEENEVKINWNKVEEPSLIEEFVSWSDSSKFIFEVFNFIRSYKPSIVSTFISTYQGSVVEFAKKFGCGTSIIFSSKAPEEIDDTKKYQYAKLADNLWEVGNLFNGSAYLFIVDDSELETIPDYFRFDKLVSGDIVDTSYSLGTNNDVVLTDVDFTVKIEKKKEDKNMCCGSCNKEVKVDDGVQAIPVGESSTKASVGFILDAISHVDVYELIEKIKAVENSPDGKSSPLLRSILNHLTMV